MSATATKVRHEGAGLILNGLITSLGASRHGVEQIEPRSEPGDDTQEVLVRLGDGRWFAVAVREVTP